MTNKQKRITAFIVMLAVLIAIIFISQSFYQTAMMFIGSWQAGSWVGNWARAVWPEPVQKEVDME